MSPTLPPAVAIAPGRPLSAGEAGCPQGPARDAGVRRTLALPASAGTQNTQIWTVSVSIGIELMFAQNGGYTDGYRFQADYAV